MRSLSLALTLGLAFAAPVSAEPDDTLLRLAEIAYPAANSDFALAHLDAIRLQAALRYGTDIWEMEFATLASTNLNPVMDLSFPDVIPETEARFGFRFDDISAAAVWSQYPEDQAALMLRSDVSAIGPALIANGYSEDQASGGAIYRLGEDHESVAELNPPSIFYGHGQSMRFAPRDAHVFYARSDAGLAGPLSGTGAAASVPAIRAMLEAAIAQEDLGTLTQAYFIQAPIRRQPVLDRFSQIERTAEAADRWADAPIMPAPSAVAFLEWRMLGAGYAAGLGLHYSDEATATAAADTLAQLMTRPLVAVTENTALEDLGPEVEYLVVARENGAVLLVIFPKTLSPDLSGHEFSRSTYWGLYRLYLSWDLALLVGH